MPGLEDAQRVEPPAGGSFDFPQLPAQSGLVSTFNIAGASTIQGVADPDNFVYSFDGYLDVQTAGTYRFQTISDDGSRLYIGGALRVNNDGVHPATTVTSGDVILAVGKVAIRVTYFEQTATQSLVVN